MGAGSYAGSSGFQEVNDGEMQEQQLLLSKDRSPDDQFKIEVAPSRFGFNFGYRPYQDVGFSIAFVVLLLASVVVGFFGVFNQNGDYYSLSAASYDRSTGCTIPDGSDGGNWKSDRGATTGRSVVRNLLSLDAQTEMSDPSLKAVLYVILATVILSAIVLAPSFLWLLRAYTRQFVYATFPFFFIVTIGPYVAFFVFCLQDESCSSSFDATLQYSSLAFVVVINLLFLWILYKNIGRVEMTIRIIRTATEALYRNTGLLAVLPALNFVYCVYLIPAFAFLYFAYTNGKITPNPDLVETPGSACGRDSQVQCCVWQVDAWVPAYVLVTGFVMLWGAAIMSDVHVYTIGGTISQWYFAASESSTVGSTRRSLGHALGPSFGTLSISGLVSTIVQMIRTASESTRAQHGNVGFAAIIIRACLECILSAIEFVTKFTTIFASITGESFCSSAHLTFDLLQRNYLSTLMVETISGQLLSQAVVAISIVYGLFLWGVLTILMPTRNNLWVVAILGSLVVLFVLTYCCRLLHNVIDTVYICYAMDLDEDEVSKPEVHDVYILLPPSQDGTASVAVPIRSGNGISDDRVV